MQSNKYYDHYHSHFIDLEQEGCNLNAWKQNYGQALFAKHPKGFLVFLPPDELDVCDEYSKSDPYTVETNIENEFHKRRIDCTLKMIKEAVNKIEGVPRILDLGCGQGHITSIIQKAFLGAEVSGLDYSISAIEYAADHFSGIDFIVGNAYESPYAENYFDIVVCNNLWEHVFDPLVLLKRISMIIKFSGFLIISTPSRYRVGNLLRVLRGKPVRLMSTHHVTEYSVGQVIEQLFFGGFKVIEIFSKPLRTSNVIVAVANKIFSLFIHLTGSHHQLESTVFYLAQKEENVTKQSELA